MGRAPVILLTSGCPRRGPTGTRSHRGRGARRSCAPQDTLRERGREPRPRQGRPAGLERVLSPDQLFRRCARPARRCSSRRPFALSARWLCYLHFARPCTRGSSSPGSRTAGADAALTYPFGPAITCLFADKIDELYDRFHPPVSRFKVGQVLWAAVAVDDPPRRNKRIEDTELVPVILAWSRPKHQPDRGHWMAGENPPATRSFVSAVRPTSKRQCSALPTSRSCFTFI